MQNGNQGNNPTDSTRTYTPGASLTKEMKDFFNESVKALKRSIKEFSSWQKDPSPTTPFERMLPVTRDLSIGPRS